MGILFPRKLPFPCTPSTESRCAWMRDSDVITAIAVTHENVVDSMILKQNKARLNPSDSVDVIFSKNSLKIVDAFGHFQSIGLLLSR